MLYIIHTVESSVQEKTEEILLFSSLKTYIDLQTQIACFLPGGKELPCNGEGGGKKWGSEFTVQEYLACSES